MARAEVRSTAFDLAFPERKRSNWLLSFVRRGKATAQQADTARPVEQDPEYKLPKTASLLVVLLTSGLLQISFFIIVSSSNAYAQHLGGTSTFSGLVIGIPTVFSGLALLPLLKLDQGGYRIPLHFACGSAVLGHVLYALAYRANFLYLILIGRIVSGFGFTFWMYSKRYCSDHRIVGIRRRTTLAGWLVLGQGIGFSFGPFVGGVLYKVGFSNEVFNGYTSPAWIMAAIWSAWWVLAGIYFEDVPPASPSPSPASMATIEEIELPTISAPQNTSALENVGPSKSRETFRSENRAQVTEQAAPSNVESITESLDVSPRRTRMSGAQFGVTATMCWFAMTCFFILGAWESNIPVFTAPTTEFSYGPHPFDFSPFAAGNLIALGGVCTFPFLLLNVFLARRFQDRLTLLAGTSLGALGLVILLATLGAHRVTKVSLFFAWFLVALGFNLASTVTLSLLSKQLPSHWNTRISVAIQYSNYAGRVTGAVWGGAGVKVGMKGYVGLELAIVGIGIVMFSGLWRQLKAKTG